MSDSILGGLRMIRPSDMETHSVEVAYDQPVCIACMAILPQFPTVTPGYGGWPFHRSCERDCTMSIAAPGGAEVCHNCLTLNSSEHHFNRGTAQRPITCVLVPPEYASFAYSFRILARGVALCQEWGCQKVVLVEHTDKRTMLYTNLFNQIQGQDIGSFVRSQRRLPDVKRVKIITRDEMEAAYVAAHDLYKTSPKRLRVEDIPTLAIQSANKLGQDLAIFTSTLDGHSRVIQCLIPQGGNMPRNAAFDAHPVASPIGNQEGETMSDGDPMSQDEEDENMGQGGEDENMSGVEMDEGESDGSVYEDSTEGSGDDDESVDSEGSGAEEDGEDWVWMAAE